MPISITQLRGLSLTKGFVEDIAAIVAGVIDGYLLANKHDTIFLVKNIGIPAVDALGIVKLPPKIVGEAEGMLGMMVYSLLKK